jgi:DNA processing protein
MLYTELDLVRLHSGIGGMTPKLMRHILLQIHEQNITLNSLFQRSQRELQQEFAIPERVADALVRSTDENAHRTLIQLQEKRFSIMTCLDETYPRPLKRFGDDMPPLLYVHGMADHLNTSAIGFGGSRNVSTEGLHAADELARSAVRDHGLTVISGHAKGVDVIAHQSALAVGGLTTLVLPEGALVFRLNPDLRAYWSDASERIVIATQFAPHEPWSARNAMTRNATIIGLAQAFCVIEAGDEQGGTWAAGKTAQRMNMPLYVLDYQQAPESASGNAKLIALGGIPVPHQKALKMPKLADSSVPPPGSKPQVVKPVQQSLF